MDAQLCARRKSLKLSMLVLQKFRAVREMSLFVCLVCEGEVKVMKWSLMSLTIMPDCVLLLGVFVSMWSMSEW